MQPAIAAIARGQQGSLEQRRADAVALPRLLDADRGFRLRGKRAPSDAAPPRHASRRRRKKPCTTASSDSDKSTQLRDEFIGHAAAEAAVPARRFEPQQMVAIFVRFADPQLADHAAVGKNFLHCQGSSACRKGPLDRVLPSGRVRDGLSPFLTLSPESHNIDILLRVANFGKAKR